MKRKRAPASKDGELETLRRRVKELESVRGKLKETEKALRESEERFGAVLSSVHETVIGVMDREGRNAFVGMSPELEKRYGLTARECVGKSVRDLLPAHNAEEIITWLQKLLRTGKAVRFETIVGFPGGDVWHEITLSPVRSSSGRITSVVAFVRDVDEQKRTEQALRENEHRFRRLFDHSNDAIFIHALDGQILDVNGRACEMLGYDRDKLLSMRISSLHPDEEHAASEGAFRATRETGFVRFESRFRKADGKTIDVEISSGIIDEEQGVVEGIVRNISERKLAEEALKSSWERLEYIIDNTWDIIFQTDLKGNYTFANKAAERVTGYPLGQLLRKNMAELLAPEYREQTFERLRRRIAGEPLEQPYELELIARDGQRKAMELTTTGVYSNGKLVGVQGIARNVTARRQAEAALRESEERFRNLLDNLPVGVYRNTPGPRGKFLMANRAMARLHGYDSPEELLKIDVAELHDDPRDRITFSDRLIAEGELAGAELSIRRKDGSSIWGAVTARVVRDADGRPAYFDGMVEDITERKRAEEALRESEERFRNLIDNLPVGVYRNTPGPSGKFLMANRAMARLHGYDSLEEFLRIDVAELHTDPAERKVFSDKLIAEGELIAEELRIRRKDGTYVWGAFTARVVRDADGKPAYFDGIVEEIAERKRAEEALRESEQRMRLILENTTDGIDICERDPKTGKRRLVLCNDRFVEMSGRSREELMAAEDLSELIRSHTPPEQTRQNHDRLVRGLPHQGQASWIRPDGKENYYEWTSAPIQVGDKQFLIGIDRDLTQRRRDEAALRESEERMRLILENSSDGINICEIDPVAGKRRLLLCNDRFVEMSGYTLEELMAADDLNRLEISRMSPGEERINQERLAQGRPIQGLASWIRQDGSENYYEWTAAPIEMGKRTYIVGVDRDITGRMRTEAALREARRKLTTAREEERKRLAAELHDSVGQGLIALQLAMRNIQSAGLPHGGPGPAGPVAQARKQCDVLIRNVRNISHGLYPPTLELGLASALGALVRDFGAQDRATVVCDIPQKAGRLPEDVEIALFRIAREGLVNAVRHSQAKKISLEVAYADGEALLTVRDDGVGFDPSEVVGKGLGLSMMNERAQAVGGELTIDSGAGRTSVRARVPATPVSSGPEGG